MAQLHIKNKNILIFGGTGSLGKALVRRLGVENNLALFSRDEAKHWTIKNQLPKHFNVQFIVGDIRDKQRSEEAILNFNPHVVIIASALKQVDTCENSPFESIQTNILGIKNVIDAVTNNTFRLSNIHTVLMVSTDKACAPTNVYGMCKAVSERVVTNTVCNPSIRFVGVRYGNVLESRGSIIPLFRHQAEMQSHFTITHEDMTRFIMTLDQSIDLIESTVLGASSGEIWLPKLNAMRILDLVNIFSKRYSKPIKTIGIRPGEKLHEDLLSEHESYRVKIEDGFYKLAQSNNPLIVNKKPFSYASNHDLLSSDELESYLDSIGIFTRPMSEFIGREIEEIVDIK